jgi:hypothetical protein
MNALYPEMAIDREAVIATVHGLQVDLQLLADWLAREPEPAMHQAAMLALSAARFRLDQYAPSVRRH